MEIAPGLWADHRRCVFLEREGVLAVSDLHLGYAWAHRFSGQMMPLQPDGVRERLLELCENYKPRLIAVLGDFVHRAVPVNEVREEFLGLVEALRANCGVKLVLGNHDKGLKKLVGGKGDIEFEDVLRAGRFTLLHGNESAEFSGAEMIIMGHEHPAISLGDGVRAAKFPCFLVSERVIVLPAFSRWAAGSEFRYHRFMSPLAKAAVFRHAIAILNGKLLPVRL